MREWVAGWHMEYAFTALTCIAHPSLDCGLLVSPRLMTTATLVTGPIRTDADFEKRLATYLELPNEAERDLIFDYAHRSILPRARASLIQKFPILKQEYDDIAQITPTWTIVRSRSAAISGKSTGSDIAGIA